MNVSAADERTCELHRLENVSTQISETCPQKDLLRPLVKPEAHLPVHCVELSLRGFLPIPIMQHNYNLYHALSPRDERNADFT